jgi:L-ascorbate metabolism protein UlaG (beta-lactamase superfamily)
MSQMSLTHIGGPTMLIEVEGWRILTDPTFDPPGQQYSFGWGTGSRKLTGPAISPESLGSIDAVLLTHNGHADNLDPTGRAWLPRLGSVLTTKAGAHRLGAGSIGLTPWQSTCLDKAGSPSLAITATPARHGPIGTGPIVGPVIGFALAWAGQEHGQLWITGDTVFYRGLREVARRITVGTALVHLDGVRFPISGPLRYTMTGERAAALCELLDPKTIVPVHYEGWSHFRQGRPEAERALAASAIGSRIQWLTPGLPAAIDA